MSSSRTPSDASAVASTASASDLHTLRSIFSSRTALKPPFLEAVLLAHGSLNLACDYLSSLSDADVPELHNPSHLNNSFPTSLNLSDPHTLVILTNIKDIVVPSLTSFLEGTPFPDITARADRLTYSLSGLNLNSLRLDVANVTIEIISPSRILVRARQASLALHVQNWSYRLRFPPLRDSGSANVSCTGVSADLTLTVECDGSISVADCVCRVGNVMFRANNARFSFLYNTLAPIVRAQLRTVVENGLHSALRTCLEDQVSHWRGWPPNVS